MIDNNMIRSAFQSISLRRWILIAKIYNVKLCCPSDSLKEQLLI